MKTITTIALAFLAFSTFAQVEIVTNGNVGINQGTPQRQLHVTDENEIQVVIENNGSDGAGVRLENSNNYQWEIINESMDYWGHPNALGFYNRSGNGHISLILTPDNSIHANGNLYVGYYSAFLMSQFGVSSTTLNYDFNPNTTNEGLLIQQSKSESSGIYFDGDYCTIFSPGDHNRLLRVLDEDGMQEKWFIDGSGNAFTNSDSTRKEDIKDLDNLSNDLKKLHPKKYFFKVAESNGVENTNNAIGFPTGMIGKDSLLIPIDKKIKEDKNTSKKRECYGFLAQDVEEVFPNLVVTNEDGDKFVSYTEFIPLLVEGYNKQDDELLIMEHRIAELEKMIEKLTAKLK